MSKMIKCRGCGAEISKGVKKCPQCGTKNKKYGKLTLSAVIVILILIFVVSGRVRNDNEKKAERNSKYSWPTTGVAILLPEPESIYGKISWETEESFSMYVYSVSSDSFREYVDRCKDNGFTVDYRASSTSYSANDVAGNNLSLYYDERDKELHISISGPVEESDSKETEKEEKPEEPDGSVTGTDSEDSGDPDEENASEPDYEVEKSPEESESENNNKSFRAWVDSYEDFMNEYIDFMQEYEKSGGNDMTLLLEYTKYITKYAEFIEETEKVDKNDLSVDDYVYFTEAQMRISKKLGENY